MIDKRAAKREYLETPRPAGVYQIRNTSNGKLFVASSVNLDGIFNRYRFNLIAGNHPNKALQAEWNEFGADNFAFEVLEELEVRADLDTKVEVTVLEDLWIEKLRPFGERGYNEPKKTREERLRMIAANRKL